MYEIYFVSNFQNSMKGMYIALFLCLILPIGFPYLKRRYDNFFKSNRRVNFGWVFIAIYGFILVKAISYYKNDSLITEINSGDFFVIEGVVENLKVTQGNSREESFNVDNVHFIYNDYGTRKPFFANRSHDYKGIKEGQKVKISYIEDGGEKLIFDIRIKRELEEK